LLRIQKLSGAKAIALAGQMPGVFIRHGIKMEKPFVNGVRGTVYSVVETIETLTHKQYAPECGTMVVVGVGHMGGEVVDYLQGGKWQVHGIDIRRSQDGVLLPDEGAAVLAQADMVIVLTPKGFDFKAIEIYDDWHYPGIVI
jgi:lactate dehydrogenase-like 2-hydroxyacid dehydrogenase